MSNEVKAEEHEGLKYRLSLSNAALVLAARQFERYAELHAAKTPPDTKKSSVNACYAVLCKAALNENAMEAYMASLSALEALSELEAANEQV